MPEPEPEPTRRRPTVDPDDEPVARISLRLPQSVKVKVDEMAAADGISTNAWLIRRRDGRPGLAAGHWPDRHVATATHRCPRCRPGPVIFGPHGPFGPHGVFGPHGPFGVGRPVRRASRARSVGERRARGRVQGWVR